VSEKQPHVTALAVIKVLEKLDYHLSRQSESHRIYKNNSGKRTTVPFHPGVILHPKVLKIY
jgi:predicted RNA binding protein YcfA (HicA-like mRNA interferase family)